MAGVTDTGFVTKTEPEIFAELEAAVRSKISPSADTSKNGPLGRLLALIAAARAEDWEVAEGVYNSQYEGAGGQSLDYVCALTGTTRTDPTYSTVTATVNMDIATAVTAGQIIASVVGNPNALFENVADFTAPSTGNHSLEFIAQTSGPVQAPSGTLTVLEVTITGVNSITNALDADPGENQELDPALRVKRRSELAAQGTGTTETIRADVARVAGVESVKVLTNLSGTPDGNQPGHSFQVSVFGGDTDAIAQAIWDSMPSGITNYGTTSGTATDAGGNSQTISLTRPTEIRVYADVVLVVNADLYPGDSYIQAAISAFTTGVLEIELPDGSFLSGEVGVGTDIYASVLYNAVYTVAGVIDATIKVGITASPTGTSVAIADDEIVAVSSVKGIQTADIAVSSA